MRVLWQCDGRGGGFAVRGFGAIFAGSIHGNGWVHRCGSARWNHAMEANASSCSTKACCEQPCPATTPLIYPTTISSVIPPIPYPLSCLLKEMPLIRVLSQSSFSSRFPLPFSSLITHSGHLTVSPPRVLISSPTLRVKPDRLNGCSEVYGSRRRKKQMRSLLRLHLACRLLLMMLSRWLLDDRQQFDGEGHSIHSFSTSP